MLQQVIDVAEFESGQFYRIYDIVTGDDEIFIDQPINVTEEDPNTVPSAAETQVSN